MTRHDPTEEAETIPGIPSASSDLEKFPSVPGFFGGAGALTLDVDTQELIVTVGGTTASPTTVTISAVVIGRTYVILQGSVEPPIAGGGSNSWIGIDNSLVWELTNSTTVSFWRNETGLTQRVRFNVIEYL